MLRGFSAQAALDAPRFCISAGSPEEQSNSTGDAGDINSEVYFEEGIDVEVVQTLRGKRAQLTLMTRKIDLVDLEMGHDARMLTGYARSMVGRGQVIQRTVDPSGNRVWVAGSDPRADGHAAAQI